MVKNIGLCGLSFDSGNMGCRALAYSFYYILEELIDENSKTQVYVFTEGSGEIPESLKAKGLEIIPIRYSIKNLKSIKNVYKYIKKCDVVFDFTEGDSFSDIYGLKRFLRVCFTKILTIKAKGKLVLCPQTYGPYKSNISKFVFKHIVKNCHYICARDENSSNLVKKLCNLKISSFIDVAFGLPFEKQKESSGRKKIGLNVSGLLWRGGYTGKNQFDLKTDYKKYIIELIESLKDEYEIHLIPHVLTKDINNIENDFTANKEIKKMYPEVICAPKFESPIDAKSYISKMDLFIGARMHATIAAFSSGVAVIPFSYSKKFEGLYDSLNYNYVIHGVSDQTEISLKRTFDFIEKMEDIETKVIDRENIFIEKLEEFKKKVEEILKEVK